MIEPRWDSEALTFVDPPEKHRKRQHYDWDSVHEALKANPGQWAVLPGQGYVSTYNAISQSKISNFRPSMGVEARTSDNDMSAKPRTCTIHVRYNPDLDESLTVKEREKIWIQIRKIEKEKKMEGN